MIALIIAIYCQSFIDFDSCFYPISNCYEKFSTIYPDMDKKEVLDLCIGTFNEN